MVRVLLVGKGEPDRGGIPTFLRTLLSGDLAQHHELEFLNLARSSEPRGGQLTLGNLRRTGEDLLAVWRRASTADVVHIHTALAPSVTAIRAGLLSVASRLRGSQVILHAHGGLVRHWMDRRSRRLLLRVVLAPARRVVAVSAAVQQSLVQAVGAEKVRLIDNGVDTHVFRPAERRQRVPRVLFVGLLTPRKGVLDLFEASRLLAMRGVDHELLLVGGTPDEGGDAEEMVRAAAPETAQLLGPRPADAMAEAYRDAEVFCLPSWWEATPLSVLEAMASGLPVVATDVGDVGRVVSSAAGFVVPAREPEALAAALEKVLVDDDLRREMGTAGRERVQASFSSDSTAQRIDALYREVTATA